MKYIDAERLKEEIKRQADLYQDTYTDSMRDSLLSFIDSIQQELDKNPEEAAEKWIDKYVPNHPNISWSLCYDKMIEAFKAGVELAMYYQEKKIADAYEKGKQEGIRVVRSWESSPGQGGY